MIICIEKGEIMKVCIYARVSTDQQELDQQISSCRKYCEARELEVMGIFYDILTGKDMIRPQFIEMNKQIFDLKRFDGVVVFRFDRLGRNAQDLLFYVEKLEKNNIKLFSISESIDTSSPIGKMMMTVIFALAQFEREAISEATKQRLKAKKDNKEPIGRPKGAKDKRPRKRSGYHVRWAKINKKMGGE
jgi:DNA invertase Pin-like site-specific DNA recombinase